MIKSGGLNAQSNATEIIRISETSDTEREREFGGG